MTTLRDWWQRQSVVGRVVITFLTAIGALTAAITGTPAAWETLGLPKVATHAYIDQRLKAVEQPISDLSAEVLTINRQNATARIETKQGRREFLSSKRFDRDLYLRTTPNIDVRLRAEIEQQIREMDTDIADLDREIRLLRDQRAGRN